jgi:plasmid maintenance system killer protein
MVKVEFRNAQLMKLYEEGRARTYPLDASVIRRFVAVVGWFKAAKDIHDLWKLPSLNFEALKGYPNRYSARVSAKYRVEMEIDWENPEKTIGLVGIVELSNHYGGK